MTIKQKLEKIAKEGNLRAYVAEEMLENLGNYNGTQKEQMQSWYNDLMRGGCQSGFISGLIYYADTHKFFDRYYDDINEMVADGIMEYKNDGNGDMKNKLAWMGFEETARKIADEVGLEA